jgi:hypothetical protein
MYVQGLKAKQSCVDRKHAPVAEKISAKNYRNSALTICSMQKYEAMGYKARKSRAIQ